MSMPESKFPTLRDLHATLGRVIDEGLGDLPFQLVVAPDSTLQAIARASGATDDSKPALMIEWEPIDDRLPVSIVSSARLSGGSPRQRVQ